jgi:hypothetical protein
MKNMTLETTNAAVELKELVEKISLLLKAVKGMK